MERVYERRPARAAGVRNAPGSATARPYLVHTPSGPHRLSRLVDGIGAVMQRVVGADAKVGTRIIITRQSETFYLAAGTVRGVGSQVGTLSVEFDMRPGTNYDVPYADMDPHTTAAKYAGVRDDMHPRYGSARINGVPSLVKFMGEHYSGAHWAFSGSVAIKYWAMAYGIPFREPADMDIVVDSLHNAWFAMSQATGKSISNPPGPAASHRTVQLANGSHLDILNSEGPLGSFGTGVRWILGVPVVPLATLREQKMEQNAKSPDIAVIDAIRARAIPVAVASTSTTSTAATATAATAATAAATATAASTPTSGSGAVTKENG